MRFGDCRVVSSAESPGHAAECKKLVTSGGWTWIRPDETYRKGLEVLETRIVAAVRPDERSTRVVTREYRALLDQGTALRPAGEARDDPSLLFARNTTPRYKLELFDTVYYLGNLLFDENIRFFVAYVGQRSTNGRIRSLYPRIFYKDYSLLWRVATHFIRTDEENWIGKGDLKWVRENGKDELYTAEETTNLPFEIQSALDDLSRRGGKVRRDDEAVPLVLRRAGSVDRSEPYPDFSKPRRRAEALYSVNDGRSVGVLEREGDPRSARFVPGYEPDFKAGILEVETSFSRLYGGKLDKYRILSRNKEIQFQVMAAKKHVWINPPQAITTELMSYGVRTVDVELDEGFCVPGFEYHYLDDGFDPPEFHSQIPPGYAGAASDTDPARADATRWIEKLPVIRRFRREVLAKRGRR